MKPHAGKYASRKVSDNLMWPNKYKKMFLAILPWDK